MQPKPIREHKRLTGLKTTEYLPLEDITVRFMKKMGFGQSTESSDADFAVVLPDPLACKRCGLPLKDDQGKVYDHNLAESGCTVTEMDIDTEEAKIIVNRETYNRVHFKWTQTNNLYI